MLVFLPKGSTGVSVVGMLFQLGPQSNTTINQNLKITQLRTYIVTVEFSSVLLGEMINLQKLPIYYYYLILSNLAFNWWNRSFRPLMLPVQLLFEKLNCNVSSKCFKWLLSDFLKDCIPRSENYGLF